MPGDCLGGTRPSPRPPQATVLPAPVLCGGTGAGSWAPWAGGRGRACPLGIGSHSGYLLGFSPLARQQAGGRQAGPVLGLSRPAAPGGQWPAREALARATMQRAGPQRACPQRPRGSGETLSLRSELKAGSCPPPQGRDASPREPAAPAQAWAGGGLRAQSGPGSSPRPATHPQELRFQPSPEQAASPAGMPGRRGLFGDIQSPLF